MNIKKTIEAGNAKELDALLSKDAALANTLIKWGKLNCNKTDPLHYISDCVFNKLLTNGTEADLAKILIAHGAKINGSENSETPLIGAVSLGAEPVAAVLLESDADIHATSIFGSTALHWASYVGLPHTVQQLLTRGAGVETRCEKFQSTPLFWAVHAIRYGNEPDVNGVIAAIQVLIENGADTQTENFENYSVQQLAQDTGNTRLIELLTA